MQLAVNVVFRYTDFIFKQILVGSLLYVKDHKIVNKIKQFVFDFFVAWSAYFINVTKFRNLLHAPMRLKNNKQLHYIIMFVNSKPSSYLLFKFIFEL